MKIAFHGAAQCVTGSKHLLESKTGKKLLLDCGLFQGMGKDTIHLNSRFGFDPETIDYVVLSHAHVDHSGLLPKLVKEGYKGPIYCTLPTFDLVKLLLMDSARIQESDIIHVNKIRKKQGKPPVEPLYLQSDAIAAIERLIPIDYDQTVMIDDDYSFYYKNAGHILGAAMVVMNIRENKDYIKLTFSGDVGRYNDMLIKSPDNFPQSDYVIMESTYGDKLHENVKPPTEDLYENIIETCVNNKGKLIIPAFSVGRTQELIYCLNDLYEQGRLPKVDYYLDSPLSIEVTEVSQKFQNEFNSKVHEMLQKDNQVFDFPGLTLVQSVEQSKNLNGQKNPCVIISASGMAEAGRIKHHIANNISNPNNKILLVGYCEPQSLGGKLKNGDKQVHIFGENYDVICQVGSIHSMSAHGDRDDLIRFLSCQDKKLVKKVFLVHGEWESQKVLRADLIKKGYDFVEVPELHQEFFIS